MDNNAFRASVRRLRRETRRMLGIIVLCAVIPLTGLAAYPDHAVHLIVPSPPGGGTDTSSRIIAPKLGEILGQQIVIDNRPGASGNIGAEIAARAAPDGYTLLAAIASHTSNAAMMKTSSDLARDFAPISLTVTLPNVLVSHTSLPAKTLGELIAYARARPGQLQYATAGIGANQHLAMELFLGMTGLQMLHVPYKGVGPALNDVVAGHVPLMMGNVLVALPHIRSGRLRAYGVTSAARASGAADIPTIAEAGVPGYEAVQWYGLLAPAGTPSAIINKLHEAVVRVLHDPAIRERFISDGAEPTPSASPEEFGALIRAEMKKWAKVVRDARIQPE
jgi:tripartite-type tricarboxylate transporter receptor subunit TctC